MGMAAFISIRCARGYVHQSHLSRRQVYSIDLGCDIHNYGCGCIAVLIFWSSTSCCKQSWFVRTYVFIISNEIKCIAVYVSLAPTIAI